MTRTTRFSSLAAMLVACLALPAAAAPVAITSDAADYEAQVRPFSGNTLSASATVNPMRAGGGGSGTSGASGRTVGSPVLLFALPTLNPGETITSASLSVVRDDVNSGDTTRDPLPNENIDLYGVGYDSATTADASLQYTGSNQIGGIGHGSIPIVKLQEDLVTPSTPFGSTATTNVAGGAALLAYIQSLYTAGAQGGDYAMLRLSLDSDAYAADPSLLRRYGIFAGNSSVEENKPVLTLNVVPEPASLGMLGCGIAALVIRRVRR